MVLYTLVAVCNYSHHTHRLANWDFPRKIQARRSAICALTYRHIDIAMCELDKKRPSSQPYAQRSGQHVFMYIFYIWNLYAIIGKYFTSSQSSRECGAKLIYAVARIVSYYYLCNYLFLATEYMHNQFNFSCRVVEAPRVLVR